MKKKQVGKFPVNWNYKVTFFKNRVNIHMGLLTYVVYIQTIYFDMNNTPVYQIAKTS